jgi:prepilin-type processing-associated H-X9-DG protein
LNPIKSWTQVFSHGQPQRIYRKEADLILPGAANTWVFIDENPFSINDGSFVCDVSIVNWVDIPASYHGGAGGIAFADSHAEIKRWHDNFVLNCTKTPTLGQEPPQQSQPPNADLIWLQQRSSVLSQ